MKKAMKAAAAAPARQAKAAAIVKRTAMKKTMKAAEKAQAKQARAAAPDKGAAMKAVEAAQAKQAEATTPDKGAATDNAVEAKAAAPDKDAAMDKHKALEAKAAAPDKGAAMDKALEAKAAAADKGAVKDKALKVNAPKRQRRDWVPKETKKERNAFRGRSRSPWIGGIRSDGKDGAPDKGAAMDKALEAKAAAPDKGAAMDKYAYPAKYRISTNLGRICINCGVYELFQDMTEECCGRNTFTKCVFLDADI